MEEDLVFKEISKLSSKVTWHFGHSNRCVVVSHCCFHLHLPDDLGCRASFHMLICLLDIFFAEVSVKVFGPFLNGLCVFLPLSFKSSLCIQNSSILSDIWFATMFFQSVVCLFIHINNVFRTEFKILAKCNYQFVLL